ncbi:hypothetical protein Tco_0916204 [Tanacetum coccineum]
MDEAYASRLRWMIYLVVLADAAESVRDTIGLELLSLASSSGHGSNFVWNELLVAVLWAEFGESSLSGPDLVHESMIIVVLIKKKLKEIEIIKKSYADNRRNTVRVEKVFVPMLVLHVPLDEIKVDKTLCFVEEPVEIRIREVKSLKRSRISLVKVRWNSKRGPDIDVIDKILEEDFDALLDECGKILFSIEGTLLEEEIFAEFDEFMPMTADENSNSDSRHR